jgi:hypothetical protein
MMHATDIKLLHEMDFCIILHMSVSCLTVLSITAAVQVNIILPIVLYGCETGPTKLREENAAENIWL